MGWSRYRIAALGWFMASACFAVVAVLTYASTGQIGWLQVAASVGLGAVGVMTLRQSPS